MIIHSNQVIWKAEGISPQELRSVLSIITGHAGSPVVDVDILNLYHKARYSNSHASACNYIARKFVDLAYEGFKVNGILDGQVRPDCKRSSWKRASDNEFAKINSHFNRQKALLVASLLDNEEQPISSTEAVKLRNEIKKLNAESLYLDRKQAALVPKSLKGDIDDAIFRVCIEENGYNQDQICEWISEAKFQADSMIAHRVKNGRSHIAYGIDTDYHVLLGPEHIILRNFQNVSRKAGVSDIRCDISGCSKETMEKVHGLLMRDKIIWKDVKYPVFDTESPVLRSLIAITLGTDVWPGIKGVGPARVLRFLNELKAKNTPTDHLEKFFMGFMIKEASKHQPYSATPFDRDVIQALSSAILDEPVVKDSDIVKDAKWEYIFGMPSELPECLSYFSQFGLNDFSVEEEEKENKKNVHVSKEDSESSSEESSSSSDDESDDGILPDLVTREDIIDSDDESDDGILPDLVTREDIIDSDDEGDDESPPSGTKNDVGASVAESTPSGTKNDVGASVAESTPSGTKNNVGASVAESTPSSGSVVTKDNASVSAGPSVNNNEDNKGQEDIQTWNFVERGVANKINIVDGAPFGHCKGILDVCQPHLYLLAEGTYSCKECGVSFCRTCGFVPEHLSAGMKKKEYNKGRDNTLCFHCYKTSSIGDVDTQDISNTNEMKQKLNDLNVKVSPDILPHEMEDLLEHHTNEVPLFHRNAHDAEFPLYSTSFFDDVKENIFFHGPIFSPHGFLSNEAIPDKAVPMIVRLMASFVVYGRNEATVYDKAAPSIIIDFSNRSRTGGGTAHKLIKSCIRHATDPRFPAMLNQHYSLFYHKCKKGDSVGLILNGEVPASMKEVLYPSRVAYTVHDLLACGCECLASGEGTEDSRVTCVHNMPLIFYICILFHSGLATNFLHDLAARWNGDIDASVRNSPILYTQVRKDIVALMRASGEDESVIANAVAKENIPSMLDSYQVTTQRQRCCNPPPAREHELIPFRQLPVMSSQAKGKRMRTCCGTTSTQEDISNDKACRPDKSLPDVKAADNDQSESKSDLSETPAVSLATVVTSNLSHEAPSASQTTVVTSNLSHRAPSASQTTVVTSNLSHQAPANASETHSTSTSSRTSTTGTRNIPVVTANVSETYSTPTSSRTSTTGTRNVPVVTNTVPRNDSSDGGRRGTPHFIHDGTLQAHRITFDEHHLINTAGRDEMPQDVVYDAYRALIGRYTFRRSADSNIVNNWLTDEIVNRYAVLLNKENEELHQLSHRSYVFSSHFYFWLTQTNRGFDYDGIENWCHSFNGRDIFNRMHHFIIPVCLNNSHWSLITVDFLFKTVKYIDSLCGSGAEHIDSIMRFLAEYARRNNFEFNEERWLRQDMGRAVPQQLNSDDCGIFMLLNTYLTLHEIDLDYTQEGVLYCDSRKIIALSLLRDHPLPPITIGRQVEKNLNVTERDFAPEAVAVPSPPKPEPDRQPSSSDSTNYADNEAVNRVKSVLFERQPRARNCIEEPGTPYEVDWIRCHGWLKTIYGKDIPTDFLAIEACKMRSLNEQKVLQATAGVNAEKVIKKKMSSTYNDWRKMARSITTQDSHMTDNLKVNKNGNQSKSDGENKLTLTTNRSYKATVVRRCAFPNCNITTADNVAFEKIPAFPPVKDLNVLSTKRNRDIARYYKRVLLRQVCNSLLNKPQNCNKDHRICALHKKKLMTVKKTVPRSGKKNLDMTFTFCVPVAEKDTVKTSKGLGDDRYVIQGINDVPDDQLKQLTLFAMVSSHLLEQQQKKRKGTLNATVQSMLSIEDESLGRKLKISGSVAPAKNRRNHDVVRSFGMSDAEIKSKTGFEDKKLLLAFLGIVCNGDMKSLIDTVYKGTNFFEEWFLAMEMIWGRTRLNQKDLAKDYRLNAERKNDIVDDKLRKILDCRASWPAYLTQEEDVALRPRKWDGVLGKDERVIMHDTTNIPLRFKPTQSELQKITHSIYYGGNNAKADCAVQPCGFVRTYMLWVAAITDSQYMIRNRIFEHQQRFQRSDLVGGVEIPFMNILDRGYKLSNEAFKAGKQTVQQPIFRERNQQRFTGRETLLSASIASIRSGNERAVAKAKMAGFLKKGLRPSECPERLDNVWLAWGFMVNFMFRPNI